MEKLTCIAVDDEYLALNIIEDYVKKISVLNLAGKYKSALTALEALQEKPIDIIFLDIQMPDLTGIEFIKTMPVKPKVILTTAYEQYALEGYELDIVDYLLKPIRFERFLRAVNKAADRIKLERGEQSIENTPDTKKQIAKNYFFIKTGYKSLKVKFDDILYIEGLKEYVNIYTEQKKFTKLASLKSLENELPSDAFIRIHKSYIVAIDKVDAIFGNTIEINEHKLPVGRSFKENVQKVFS